MRDQQIENARNTLFLCSVSELKRKTLPELKELYRDVQTGNREQRTPPRFKQGVIVALLEIREHIKEETYQNRGNKKPVSDLCNISAIQANAFLRGLPARPLYGEQPK